MTRDQWIEKWRPHIIGMSLRGLVFDSDERVKGPLGAGKYALELPDKAYKLLSDMWADAEQVPSNGRVAAK